MLAEFRYEGLHPAGRGVEFTIPVCMEDRDETSGFVPSSGQTVEFADMERISDRDLEKLDDVTVPVFRTATLRSIPFPEAQGIEVLASHSTPSGYCANDYATGRFLYLDLEWATSEVNDCGPSGQLTTERVSGPELKKWRDEYRRGPSDPADSVMNELDR